MTEYEINKAVAEKLGIMQYMFDGKDSESIIWNVPSNNLYNGFVSSRGNLFDPCNNVQEVWVIMLANNISVTKSRGKYISFYDLRYENPDDGHVAEIETQDEKPFVAAMLCFLEI